MNPISRYFKTSAADLSRLELLRAKSGTLLGVTDDAQAALETIGIQGVFDLATSRIFAAARMLLNAGQNPSGTLARYGLVPPDFVDTLPPGVRVEDLHQQPIAFLEGIGSTHADAVAHFCRRARCGSGNPLALASEDGSVELGSPVTDGDPMEIEIPKYSSPDGYEQYAINVEGHSPEKAHEARLQAVRRRAEQRGAKTDVERECFPISLIQSFSSSSCCWRAICPQVEGLMLIQILVLRES